MRFLFLLLFAGAASAYASSGRSPAQQPSPCWQHPDESEDMMIAFIRELVTTTDPEDTAVRDSVGLVAMPADSVAYVTSDSLCAQAIAAHINNHPPASGVTVQQILLIRVGSTRFVLRDFYSQAGEFAVFYVYDENFQEISSYTG